MSDNKEERKLVWIKAGVIVFLFPILMIIGMHFMDPVRLLLAHFLGEEHMWAHTLASIVGLVFGIWFTVFIIRKIWNYDPDA